MKARPAAASGLSRPLRIGISACLLGRRVRYDGGHKYQPWTARLGKRVEWVPVCPEVELGLGVPREPVQLVAAGSSPRRKPWSRIVLDSGFRWNDGISASPRLIGIESGLDYTRRMRAYAAARLRELARLRLSGYIFKDRSPSCGLDGVPVVAQGGGAAASGAGLFANAFRTRFPRLPVAGDGQLRDPARREEFLRAVLAYARRRDAGR